MRHLAVLLILRLAKINSAFKMNYIQIGVQTRKTSGESDLWAPFSVVAESRLRMSHDTVPFTVGSSDGPDGLFHFISGSFGEVKD
jgi:hypothetical protein